jgi:hypothetical protein
MFAAMVLRNLHKAALYTKSPRTIQSLKIQLCHDLLLLPLTACIVGGQCCSTTLVSSAGATAAVS